MAAVRPVLLKLVLPSITRGRSVGCALSAPPCHCRRRTLHVAHRSDTPPIKPDQRTAQTGHQNIASRRHRRRRRRRLVDHCRDDGGLGSTTAEVTSLPCHQQVPRLVMCCYSIYNYLVKYERLPRVCTVQLRNFEEILNTHSEVRCCFIITWSAELLCIS